MLKPPIFVDQTINQGLKQNLIADKLAELVRFISEIRLDYADISVANWQGISRNSVLPMEKFRGVIEPCCQQVILASNLGFRTVNMVVFCRRDLNSHAIEMALATAKTLGLSVVLQIRNASEFAVQALIGFVKQVNLAHVDTVLYCDEGSLLDPFVTYKTLTELKEKLSVDLEFCAHNNRGLATANTLAALKAGVCKVSAAVAGIDSFAAFEEILLAYKFLLNQPIEITKKLAQLSKEVLGCLGREVPMNKPIIGSNVFAHESGIHVDGVIKNPDLYEPFSPEIVGLSRKLVIGKHSGTASLKAKFRSWNMPLNDFDAALLLGIVRKKAISQRSSLNDCQLIDLYYEMSGQLQGFEAGGDEICRAEKKYTLSIQRYGMANKRPVLFSQRRKSLQ
ncbi:homocitrate synthase [Sporomusaceae bacterium FL31]|nr:homocitrate synthase [Sporomusaceae bacterium FL31]GCE32828.1 homocitrate synthase [Sporomusaceae bacterium]